MRSLLLAVALLGCARSAATGPAWPKSQPAEHDGGESLAPHVSRSAVTAIEKSDEDVKPAAVEAPAPRANTPAPAATGTAPAADAPRAPAEETITTEDIIIEIDD